MPAFLPILMMIAILTSYPGCAQAAEELDAHDFDVYVPITGDPLGISVGSSLQIVDFHRNRQGRLPWVVERGGLALGDRIVALEGEDISQEDMSWHLTYMPRPLTQQSVNVTVSTFGVNPVDCEPRAIVAAYPEDACTLLKNTQEVASAHVLVKRGGCSFLAKALAVQHTGGASLIVIDEGPGTMEMEAEKGQRVNIPAVMISRVDGTTLIKLADSTRPSLSKKAKLRGTLVTTRACLPEEHRSHPLHLNPPPEGMGHGSRYAENLAQTSEYHVAGGSGAGEKEMEEIEQASPVAGKIELDIPEAHRAPASEAVPSAQGGGGASHGYSSDLQGRNNQCNGGEIRIEEPNGEVISAEFVSAFAATAHTLGNFSHFSSGRQGASMRVAVLNVCAGDSIVQGMAKGSISIYDEQQLTQQAERTMLVLPSDLSCTASDIIQTAENQGATALLVTQPFELRFKPLTSYSSDLGKMLIAGVEIKSGGKEASERDSWPEVMVMAYEEGRKLMQVLSTESTADNGKGGATELSSQVLWQDKVCKLWEEVAWGMDLDNWPKGVLL